MGNREPVVRIEDGPIVGAALQALRQDPIEGISRRALLRRSIGLGAGLWLAEVGAGSIAFLWNAVGGGSSKVRVGTFEDVAGIDANLPFRTGFPMYVQPARAFVVVVDPREPRFRLGCRPNPCIEDFWFHCPCHQSRYDRLGIKPKGTGYGPAERGMDRFGVEVDADGVLTIDTGHRTLGPLPIALGQPGVIPPLKPHGSACT